MKKTFVGAACIVALVAFLLVPMSASGEGAVVINEFGCGVIDGDGGFAFAEGTIMVSNQSGNALLVCHAKGVANSTRKAVHWDYDSTGIECGSTFGLTDVWSETVSASGNARLTCLFHP